VKRALLSVKNLIAKLLHGLRRLAGAFVQFAQRDQLVELSDQTRRLGAASVESSTYVSGELQALDERLSKIEEELAALRRGLDQAE
jgi:hypothetical protein